MVKHSQDKFFIGEKVLCYEPDPNLIKKLYPAKIVNITFDPGKDGKKLKPRYWIHFIGWKKTWDWQVEKKLLIKDTAENRNLKHKIDEKLFPFVQKKFQKKLFHSMNTIHSQRLHPMEDKIKIENVGYSVPQSLKKSLGTIPIPQVIFPSPLKKILERDYDLVNNENKIPLLSTMPARSSYPYSNNPDNTYLPNQNTMKEAFFCKEDFFSNKDPLKSSSALNHTHHVLYILETYLKHTYFSTKAANVSKLSAKIEPSHLNIPIKTLLNIVEPIERKGCPQSLESQDGTVISGDKDILTSGSQPPIIKSEFIDHPPPPHQDHLKGDATKIYELLKTSQGTDVENNFEMCKEVMDGIRIWFDFIVAVRLFYQCEKELFSLSIYPFPKSIDLGCGDHLHTKLYGLKTCDDGVGRPKLNALSSSDTYDTLNYSVTNPPQDSLFPHIPPPPRPQKRISDGDGHYCIAKHRIPRHAALKAYSNLLLNPAKYKPRSHSTTSSSHSSVSKAPNLHKSPFKSLNYERSRYGRNGSQSVGTSGSIQTDGGTTLHPSLLSKHGKMMRLKRRFSNSLYGPLTYKTWRKREGKEYLYEGYLFDKNHYDMLRGSNGTRHPRFGLKDVNKLSVLSRDKRTSSGGSPHRRNYNALPPQRELTGCGDPHLRSSSFFCLILPLCTTGIGRPRGSESHSYSAISVQAASPHPNNPGPTHRDPYYLRFLPHAPLVDEATQELSKLFPPWALASSPKLPQRPSTNKGTPPRPITDLAPSDADSRRPFDVIGSRRPTKRLRRNGDTGSAKGGSSNMVRLDTEESMRVEERRTKASPSIVAKPSPQSPCKIFGFIHLLRLLAILPDILNQHNVILLYPKIFSHHLESLLQYLSKNHQAYMQSCVYVSASLIREQLRSHYDHQQ